MKPKLSEAAEADLPEALAYYDQQAPGLIDRFLDEFEKALERIAEFPHGWHKLFNSTRRCRMRKFPYGLIYQIRHEGIVIIAVANLHQEPLRWAKRVSD